MDQQDARALALALPEVSEAPHHDKVSFRVGGKIFATMPPDGEHLHVMVDEAEVAVAVAEDPVACQELRWGQRLAGVRISLSAADPERVGELLQEAWRVKAPKAVLAEHDGGRP